MVGDITHSTRSPLFDGVGGGGDGEGEEGSGGGSDGSEVLHFDNVWGFVGGWVNEWKVDGVGIGVGAVD